MRLVKEGMSKNRKLFSMNPVEVARRLAIKLFGEKGEKVIL